MFTCSKFTRLFNHNLWSLIQWSWGLHHGLWVHAFNSSKLLLYVYILVYVPIQETQVRFSLRPRSTSSPILSTSIVHIWQKSFPGRCQAIWSVYPRSRSDFSWIYTLKGSTPLADTSPCSDEAAIGFVSAWSSFAQQQRIFVLENV